MDEQVRKEILSLVDTKPELRDALRELVEEDADGTWSFQDVPLDSGQFGEIVSRGIAEETEDGYRLASREATLAALDGTEADPEPATAVDSGFEMPTVPALESRRLGLLAAALLCVVAVRTVFSYPAVFRPEAVMLSGNDPYMYYDAVRMLLVEGPPAFSPGGLSELSMDFLSSQIRTHDTLLIVSIWWIAAALGGAPTTVATVLAWYPVVAATVTTFVIYLVAMRVTDDVRCSLATVVFLAIIPAHVFRTALGFGDHHAFDYLWLSLTVLSLVVVVTPRSEQPSMFDLDRTRVAAIVGGGLAITAQTAAWRGGPLFLLPIAFYAVARLVVDLRSGDDPVRSAIPLAALLAVGAVVTLGLYLAFGWLELYQTLAPALLLVGVVQLPLVVAHRV